ncbi:MAG: RNA methyltransferase [Deltaproteobacteria bacterium HGW-Deltaproteobacteria-14]|jgi:hypothetical protein|nr:MAG: RNA methyltransferase [Deltaproteobacteria bacterium HGW-Deltaproteobacteria-14]
MAFDEGLAQRVREVLSDRDDLGEVVEKKMFGGLAFMIRGNMCCGILREDLMARVGKANHARWLGEPHAREMDFTGRPSPGMLFVGPNGVAEDDALGRWIAACVDACTALPPKAPGARNPRKRR